MVLRRINITKVPFLSETARAEMFDYFDVLMLTAAELQMQMSVNSEIKWGEGEFEKSSVGNRSIRCAYGDHDQVWRHPQDLLMVMATNYFRMSNWQKETLCFGNP